MQHKEVKKVLYIEDNIADIKLFEEAISFNDLSIKLEYVTDGQEMLNYFEASKKAHYRDLPDLILSLIHI